MNRWLRSFLVMVLSFAIIVPMTYAALPCNIDITIPADTELVSVGASRIRSLTNCLVSIFTLPASITTAAMIVQGDGRVSFPQTVNGPLTFNGNITINGNATITGTATIQRGIFGNTISTSTGYTTSPSDFLIRGNGGASGITVTMSGGSAGQVLNIVKVDAGAGPVWIVTAGQSVNGAQLLTISNQWGNASFSFDGVSQWTRFGGQSL